jgi:hypothetical protein
VVSSRELLHRLQNMRGPTGARGIRDNRTQDDQIGHCDRVSAYLATIGVGRAPGYHEKDLGRVFSLSVVYVQFRDNAGNSSPTYAASEQQRVYIPVSAR